MQDHSADSPARLDGISNSAVCGFADVVPVNKNLPNMMAELCLLSQSLKHFPSAELSPFRKVITKNYSVLGSIIVKFPALANERDWRTLLVSRGPNRQTSGGNKPKAQSKAHLAIC